MNAFLLIVKECIVLKKSLIVLPLMFFFLAGCTTTGPQKPIKVHKGQGLYEETESIIMLDSELRRQLRLVEQSMSKTEDGRLIAKARFFNKTNYHLKPQVQTLFKNEKGEVVDETNWELIVIQANSYYYHEAKSLNDKATKYTIKFKAEREFHEDD